MRPAAQALEMSDGQAGDVDRVGRLAGGNGAGGAGARALLLAAGGVANFRIGEETPLRRGSPRLSVCVELLREVAEKSCLSPPFPKSRSPAANGSGNEPVSARGRLGVGVNPEIGSVLIT